MARRTRRILLGLDVEPAQRLRKCGNSGRPIVKGELCLVVSESMKSGRSYSKEVALRMIESAMVELNELKRKIED